MASSYEEHQQALLEIAADQNGYFTAKQALEAGYSYPAQSYHVRVGHWQRVERAIYRLRGFPTQPDDEYIVLSLLTANRAGEPQAVVSYETALAVHGISDANPARIHLTVPPKFDKVMPPHVELHRARLTQRDSEYHGAYRVTTPLRTILDIASSATAWPYLEGAIRDALRLGLIRKTHLLAATSDQRIRAIIQSTLQEIEPANAADAPVVTAAATMTLTWDHPPEDTSATGSDITQVTST